MEGADYEGSLKAARAALARGHATERMPTSRDLLNAGMPLWMVRAATDTMMSAFIGGPSREQVSAWWAFVGAYAASDVEAPAR